MKKVLIAITDAGSGHRSAANALELAFTKLYPGDYEVKIVDLFKTADVEPFNTSDSFYSLVSRNRKFEVINNLGFKILNTEFAYTFFYSYTIHRLYEECLKVIEEEQSDVIISTHPVVSMIMREIKLRNPKVKSVTVITDLITLFRGWADDKADLVFAPTNDAVNTLVKMGVDVTKIIYPLFPLNPALASYRSKEEVIKELGFNATDPIVLITAGGVGINSIIKAIEMLAKSEQYQIIVIAGRLKVYRTKLEKLFASSMRVKVFGFVTTIQDYINACDIIVAKPGPATILEVELFKKKAVFTRRIGEQEIGNVDYLMRNPNFRYIDDDYSTLASTLNQLLKLQLREPAKPYNARSFDESEHIVKEVVKILN